MYSCLSPFFSNIFPFEIQRFTSYVSSETRTGCTTALKRPRFLWIFRVWVDVYIVRPFPAVCVWARELSEVTSEVGVGTKCKWICTFYPSDDAGSRQTNQRINDWFPNGRVPRHVRRYSCMYVKAACTVKATITSEVPDATSFIIQG